MTAELEELEAKMGVPAFWNDTKSAASTSRKKVTLERELIQWREIETKLGDHWIRVARVILLKAIEALLQNRQLCLLLLQLRTCFVQATLRVLARFLTTQQAFGHDFHALACLRQATGRAFWALLHAVVVFNLNEVVCAVL